MTIASEISKPDLSERASGTEADFGNVNLPVSSVPNAKIALLTGGIDKPYAIGLTSALASLGVAVDYIGSDDVDGPDLHNTSLVSFLNLRGDQSENVNFFKKMVRVIRYYCRLIKYAAWGSPAIFHILWNNRFELFDRTLLMLYYRLLGKKITFTAHNVNAAKRDAKDSWLNRWSLRIQYHLTDHIFVHTKKMEQELLADFNVPKGKVSVIPFGLNEIYPSTRLTSAEARNRLKMRLNDKAVLFFGRIAPYKGLEYLVSALAEVGHNRPEVRLLIAGKIEKGCSAYWERIQQGIHASGIADKVIERIEFIPDSEVELYLKAADVLVIPYTNIFQSGVPFLAYSFGLPVIATDVGSLKEDVIEGKTGFICKPNDSADLARCIEKYFASELFLSLEIRRQQIREFARERHSWTRVARLTLNAYQGLKTEKNLVSSESRNLTPASH